MKKKNKKNRFKIFAESFAFGGLKYIDLPTPELDENRVSREDLKRMIKEEFGEVKKVEDLKPKLDTPWEDSDLENEVEWAKALSLKEFHNLGAK